MLLQTILHFLFIYFCLLKVSKSILTFLSGEIINNIPFFHTNIYKIVFWKGRNGPQALRGGGGIGRFKDFWLGWGPEKLAFYSKMVFLWSNEKGSLCWRKDSFIRGNVPLFSSLKRLFSNRKGVVRWEKGILGRKENS